MSQFREKLLTDERTNERTHERTKNAGTDGQTKIGRTNIGPIWQSRSKKFFFPFLQIKNSFIIQRTTVWQRIVF